MTSRDVVAGNEESVMSRRCSVIRLRTALAAHVRLVPGGSQMTRPVTLFTGQWADLPLETIAGKAASWGFDGLELACWGDHFEVDKALGNDSYVRSRRDILEKHRLKVFAISNHLVGQAVCDRIDERHKSILPPRVWGDAKPDGVQRCLAEEMVNTARAAKALGVGVVPG